MHEQTRQHFETLFARQITDEVARQAEFDANDVVNNIRGRFAGNVKQATGLWLMHMFAAEDAHRTEDILHLDIGMLHGASFIIAAKAVQFENEHSTVIGVDPLDGYYTGDARLQNAVDPNTRVPVSLETVSGNLKAFDVAERRFQVVACKSSDSILQRVIEGRPIGSVYIDGDHTCEGLTADWIWLKALLTGGAYVMVDDYANTDFPGVRKFVDGLTDMERLGAVEKGFLLRAPADKGEEIECEPTGIPF